jgi:hypothetical protein
MLKESLDEAKKRIEEIRKPQTDHRGDAPLTIPKKDNGPDEDRLEDDL